MELTQKVRSWTFLCSSIALFLFSTQLMAQETETVDDTEVELPGKVNVEQVASDEKISARITKILNASSWFENPTVEVESGVVFLKGMADTTEHKQWAGELAGKTEDVIAVVNQMKVAPAKLWDIAPLKKEGRNIAEALFRSIPLMLISALLLLITFGVMKLTMFGVGVFLGRSIESALLRNVIQRTAGLFVFLLGLSFVFRVSGLTQIAMTILGGTGLFGLVIGFAFKDIAENFLASILLSIQRPFRRSDFIGIAGFEGYVTSVNARSTLLMTRDGNHVQIPNATIYKETIVNYTANELERLQFTIGIGYNDSISKAQEIAYKIVSEHESIEDDPPPQILVDELGPATVNLRVLFWTNIKKFDRLKVRSSIIRAVKVGFDQQGISMPDEAREVVFPEGVPVQMTKIESKLETAKTGPETQPATVEEDLSSDADDILTQAKESRDPEEGTDLL